MSSSNITQFSQKINYHLERLIPITTPFGIALGFFFPSVFIHLRPFVPYLFGLMTFSGALKLQAKELTETIRSPVPIIMFFITAHLIMPVVAMFSSSLVFADIDIVTGFVLLFAGPTAVSSFIWVLIFKGDKALGLSLILLSTILAPVVVPFTLLILLGQTVTMDMTGIAISLMMMVVIPTIIGVSVNEITKGKGPALIAPYLDPVSKICLILVIAANASPVLPDINFLDPVFWKTAIVCILLIIIGFFIIYYAAVAVKCKGEKSISLFIAGGLRNNSATMTIAVTFFAATPAVALPVILSLITQQTIAAIFGKWFAKRSLISIEPQAIPHRDTENADED